MTLDEFKALYPDTGASDVVIQRYLNLFDCMYKGDYGCMADELQALFVAHRCYMNALSPKPVMIQTGRRVGDVSLTSEPLQTDVAQDFGASRYGVEFWSVMELFGGGGMVAGSLDGF